MPILYLCLSFIYAYHLSMPTIYLCLPFIYALFSAMGHGASGQFHHVLLVIAAAPTCRDGQGH
jgi:hypothetical protein